MDITPENTLKTQYEFATCDPREYKHPGLIGGFGSGKTRSIPLRWLNLIDWRARNQKVKCKLMIVEPTREMIRDVLVPEMNDFFNDFSISHKYHKTHHDYTINFKGHEFTALLRSSDVPESLTGKTLTDIIIDEYDKKHSISHQKDVWKECISRIRKAEFGTCGIATTPEGYKNTYELYGRCDYEKVKNFKLIRAKTYDNFFLPKDYIENLYDNYSAELVEQYIEAQFVNLLQGKVYYSFDRVENASDIEYTKELPINLMVDFNVNPMLWAVGQTWRNGNEITDHIIDEIVQNNTYTEQMARAVGDKYGYDTLYYIYGDYSGKARSTKSRVTDFDIIQEILPNSTLRIKPNPLVIDRVNAVNSRLCNSKGKRNLRVNIKNCPELVQDFEQVLFKENSKDLDKTSNPKRTHISDALGYFIEYEYSLKGKPKFHQR
jgi:hypothetical protein